MKIKKLQFACYLININENQYCVERKDGIWYLYNDLTNSLFRTTKTLKAAKQVIIDIKKKK